MTLVLNKYQIQDAIRANDYSLVYVTDDIASGFYVLELLFWDDGIEEMIGIDWAEVKAWALVNKVNVVEIEPDDFQVQHFTTYFFENLDNILIAYLKDGGEFEML